MGVLTGPEVGKVLTGAANDFFCDWEKFEDEHPDEKFQVDTKEVVARLAETAKNIGIEWAD